MNHKFSLKALRLNFERVRSRSRFKKKIQQKQFLKERKKILKISCVDRYIIQGHLYYYCC